MTLQNHGAEHYRSGTSSQTVTVLDWNITSTFYSDPRYLNQVEISDSVFVPIFILVYVLTIENSFVAQNSPCSGGGRSTVLDLVPHPYIHTVTEDVFDVYKVPTSVTLDLVALQCVGVILPGVLGSIGTNTFNN